MISWLKDSFLNFPGDRLSEKIIVIESDDWGAIRCPDANDYEGFKKHFSGRMKSPYLKYDTLASNDDLEILFNSLSSFKDSLGNRPQITFNSIMANPDFDKIRESDYEEYHFELFTNTLARFSNHNKAFDLWKKAMGEGVMWPQFHGREHVNVPLWLKLLKEGNEPILKAFSFRTWSAPHELIGSKLRLQASLDFLDEDPIDYRKEYVAEGLRLFEKVFGFQSVSFIPPNFVSDATVLDTSVSSGVKAIQGMKYQVLPKGGRTEVPKGLVRRKFKTQGEPIDLVRNCVFEPSLSKSDFDDVGSCLKQISNSFLFGKPAIITAHRINFIGAIDQRNRDKNISSLEKILSAIVRKWPDVVFMNSQQLIEVSTKQRIEA